MQGSRYTRLFLLFLALGTLLSELPSVGTDHPESVKDPNCLQSQLAWLIQVNVNAKVPLEKYEQPNARSLEEYKAALALPHNALKRGMTVIDVGGGQGAAARELALQYKAKTILINAQDISQTAAYRAAQPLIAKGKFEFRSGLAEQILPQYRGQADLLMDVWGAYSYSATRTQLIEQYHAALKPGGVAYVLIPGKIHTYVHQGSNYVPLVDYLTSRFPHVFSIRRSHHWQFLDSSVLVITRRRGSRGLQLPLKLEYLEPNVRREGFGLPKVIYREAPQGLLH